MESCDSFNHILHVCLIGSDAYDCLSCLVVTLMSVGKIHLYTTATAWISNHMPSKVSHDITDPFLNFNGCTVEVWVRKSNFIPHNLTDVIIRLKV